MRCACGQMDGGGHTCAYKMSRQEELGKQFEKSIARNESHDTQRIRRRQLGQEIENIVKNSR